MSKEIIKKLVKEGLIEQQVRIQIYPTHSWKPENVDKICKVAGITKEEFDQLFEKENYKQFFGFFNFEQDFDDLSLIYDSGSLYNLHDEKVINYIKESLNKE